MTDIAHLNCCSGESVGGLGLHLCVGRQTGQSPVALPARQTDDVDTATRGEDHQRGGEDCDDEVDCSLVRPTTRHLGGPLRLPLHPCGGHGSGDLLEAEGYVLVTVVSLVAAILQETMPGSLAVLTRERSLRREEFVPRNALIASLEGVVTLFLDPLPADTVSVAVVLGTQRPVVTQTSQAATQSHRAQHQHQHQHHLDTAPPHRIIIVISLCK